MVKAFNIQWDIDVEDAYEKLDEMTTENAAKALDVPSRIYANMTTEERHNYAYDTFHHNRVNLCEFLGVPNEVAVPEELGDDEEWISDWLSDEYGYCHEGFELNTDK